jgi:metallo-beta-lactamase family protein
LNNFYNERRLPKIEIYVDSPLAVNATTIFRMHSECFNRDVLAIMEDDPDPFGFNSLHYITRKEDSIKLNSDRKPCVIISASGMMEAGRVKHHLANNISDPRNTVLAVGYCAPSTLGARILSGADEVSIHGNRYKVKADIRKIDSYSGHGDYREMIQFLGCQTKDDLKKTFLVHGEYETQISYRSELIKVGFTNLEIPARGDEFEF